MGICRGCSLGFPSLDVNICAKCTKKGAVHSQTERDAIDKQPQCLGCGIVYPWLKGSLCGACLDRSAKEPLVFEGHTQITAFLTDRVQAYDAEASEHRLNQRPKNAALKSATEIKEKVAALKKQNKADGIDTNMQLWIYPADKVTGAPKKAQLPSLHARFDSAQSADHMFDVLALKAKEAYQNCPAYMESDFPAPFFTRNKIIFAIQQTGSNVHYVEDSYSNGTVAEFFGHLKTAKLLSDKDISAHSVTLRLFVYARRGDPDEDSSHNTPISTVRRVSATPKRPKRKASSALPEDRPSIARLSIARSSTTRPYTSAFRPNVPTLTYDAFQFRQTVCEVDACGTIRLIKSDDSKTILIGQGWQAHAKGSKPAGAYISKGFTKFAFKGRFDAADFAIFQCNPLRSTQALNEADLRDELRLLNSAQFFLDSFYKRAKAFKVRNLPAIRWNAANAFIGTVTSDLPPAGADGSIDNRSLIFNTFLAAPLLATDETTEERKFSGNDEIASNTDPLGRAVDAYVHHTLVDSFGELLLADVQGIICAGGQLCLFDPQAHTSRGDAGHWDKGHELIEKYKKVHTCNSVCRGLELEVEEGYNEKDVGKLGGPDHPLRIGFES